MEKSKIVLFLALSLGLSIGIIQINPVNAAETFCNTERNWEVSTNLPEKFTVGYNIIDIGQIDFKSGSYELDFWIFIEPESENYDYSKNPPPQIEFPNGRILDISGEYCDTNYYEYKVQGRFFNNMDFRNFPFTTIDLKIISESVSPGYLSQIILLPAANSKIDELTDITGWNISEIEFSNIEHRYDESEVFSRNIANIEISSFFIQSFIKTLFPLILLPSIAMISFWMEPNTRSDKLSITIGTLIATIAFFTLFVSNQLPPLSYLTLADKVMVVAYVLFLYAFFNAVLQQKLYNQKPSSLEDLKKLNSKMRIGIPIIVGGIFLPLHFLL